MTNILDRNSTVNQIATKFANTENRLAQIESNAWDKIRGNGWIRTGEWTHVSDFSFTTETDVTALYRKGLKLSWNNDLPANRQFGIVISSSYNAGTDLTTVVMATNTDYIFVDTSGHFYFSPIENPEAWPDWFNFTPDVGGAGAMTYTPVAGGLCQFRVSAQTVFFAVRISGTTGGVAAAYIYARLPIEALNSSFLISGFGQVNDGGLIGATVRISNAAPDLMEFRRYDGVNFGLGAGRVMAGMAIYQMA